MLTRNVRTEYFPVFSACPAGRRSIFQVKSKAVFQILYVGILFYELLQFFFWQIGLLACVPLLDPGFDADEMVVELPVQVSQQLGHFFADQVCLYGVVYLYQHPEILL